MHTTSIFAMFSTKNHVISLAIADNKGHRFGLHVARGSRQILKSPLANTSYPTHHKLPCVWLTITVPSDVITATQCKGASSFARIIWSSNDELNEMDSGRMTMYSW
jgi:hypothetical protein